MLVIRPETPEDSVVIRGVNEVAFRSSSEADLVEKLYSRQAYTLSLVATDGGVIIGHILFSPVTIESRDASFGALGLGPMAAFLGYQRKGIGSQMVRAGLEEYRLLGHEIIVVSGHPDYYPRFGFVPTSPKGIDCEFEAPDETWMVLELREGALAGRSGIVKFQPEFHEAM